MTVEDTRKTLLQLVHRRQATLVPGAFNALSARVIEELGFAAIYVTGAGVTNMSLGLPDQGFMGLAEIAEHTQRIRDVVRLPLIVDADTGFGNAVNVYHTVRRLERAGADCVQLEDQTSPKRCGHFGGKDVVDTAEMVGKIRAAVDARADSGLLVMARTDAAAVHGFEAAVERAARYAEAGADILFVEAPKTEAEMARICAELPGWKMANLVEGGETPVLPPAAIAEIGYAVAAYPLTLMSAAMRAMLDALEALKGQSHPTGLLNFADLRARVGFDEYYAEEQRYGGARQ